MALARTLGRFRDGRDGVSVVEFAILLPVLLLLAQGAILLVLYVNANRKVTKVANAIAQIISQATPGLNTTTAFVDADDLRFAYDATMVLFPYILTDAANRKIDWRNGISVNFSSIAFTKNGKTCPSGADQSSCYIASVVWTSSGVAGANFRPCLVPQTPTDDIGRPLKTLLPRSLYGPGSVIAVDVKFTFNPPFGSSILPPIDIARSAYLQPRYASLINLDAANIDPIAARCPGY